VKATFAAGCFWAVQAEFDLLHGVEQTIVGYTGGQMKEPSYEDVLTDTTGHAEAVQVTFNPHAISYTQLLIAFFQAHNPSTVPGERYKYRSTIFYHNQEQKESALGFLQELKEAKLYDLSVKTTVVPQSVFYKAEDYHQKYYQKQEVSQR